ncbi:MAG: photosystem II stability/assembly factor-like uncharacterized protein [Enterobacterales bacterium]|jgi:photosystem II stability/assembly factor-like uncharacterized protein
MLFLSFKRSSLLLITIVFLTQLFSLSIQAKSSSKQAIDTQHIENMKFRSIGPYRGGRSAAVTGVIDAPNTFYFGAAGGGVWRTEDNGGNWKNISDGFFGGSIGAVAVSEWDTNVIYVGGGEKTIRGNVSHGSGMWKSLDKGKTWKSIGLTDSHRIPRIRIHPKNPDLVYAASMGHLSGPNNERGIFRSKDGGTTWEKVLFVNEHVGFVDLIMDPNNSRVLYASSWRVKRTPYSLDSGGQGSALWKSTDGGDTWKNIIENKGMPKGTIGINGITVSPANSDRLWAMIEAKEGGLFRSDDAGKTWIRINEERKLRQRAWYYTRLYAHPSDVDSVFVLNVRFWKSKDGGKSFDSINTPHGDHHDLWINPDDPKTMIVGDDGGAQISKDSGASFSTYLNQPTAQFYRVTTDNHFPYRIYGAQQDNSTVRIDHRSSGSRITESNWEPTAGGESGHIAPNPDNPEIVYGGSYDGYLTRVDHDRQSVRLIDVWPDNPMGKGAESLKYRFQWNFPIFFSPHDSKVLYTAANHLFKSTNEGQSWQQISPDLTRNDKSKQGSSGGPITQDNTSVEYYSTIFAALESHHEKGVFWTGSDDGLIHVSKDNGTTWKDVTPKGLPDWTQINSIEVDPFNKGGLYIAGTRYKSDDFKPYLYKTENYGRSWKKIVKGIADNHFTRVIRADTKRQGMLWAGTESGLYLSMDDGKNWQAFQQNLPIVPITDIALKDDDVIIATQGRSFWLLDDVSWMQQYKAVDAQKAMQVYTPGTSYRLEGRVTDKPGNNGTNAPTGVIFDFLLKEQPQLADKEKAKNKEIADKDSTQNQDDDNALPLSLTIYDSAGIKVRAYSSTSSESGETMELTKGYNRFVWNLRYEDAKDFEGMIVWAGGVRGPKAIPGDYRAEFKLGEQLQTVNFSIKKDPRLATSQGEYKAQLDFLLNTNNKINEVTKSIKNIRNYYAQIKTVTGPLDSKVATEKALLDAAKSLKKSLAVVEETLYQTKNQSNQDPLNFPGRLLNSLMGLKSQVEVGDYPPTDQVLELSIIVIEEIDQQLTKLAEIEKNEVSAFNELVAKSQLPTLRVAE